MTQTPELHIDDFVDISLLQRLQDTFAEAMGVAAVTVDRRGKPITKTSNFCTVCQMIRSTEVGLARCQRCDAEGGRVAHERQKPYAYKCAGGLLDAAAPLIIDGQYVGCILCGQVIPADDREAFIQDILARNLPLGVPPEEFEAAVRKIEPLPRERFKAAVEMLSLTANHIIEKGAANLTQAQLLQQTQERAALQAALQEAQLRALKAQINPHFLFNSLTLLGYTALEENAARTEEIAYSLSDLLRYSLRNMSTSVELGEEMEMIEQYLAIQKIHFGDRLQSEVCLDPELQRFEIPCMVLQPLVENAVIHGAEPLVRPVTIKVGAYRENGRLVLQVSDDGVGMAQEVLEPIQAGLFAGNGRSLGLQNVFQRLASEYGSAFSVAAESAPDAGTTLRLLLDLEGDHLSSHPPMVQLFPGTAVGLGNQIHLGNPIESIDLGWIRPAANQERLPLNCLDSSLSDCGEIYIDIQDSRLRAV
jgi:two-component system, LytTR family, sensor kinase